MTDLVTFGEAMIRLSSTGGHRLEQAASLDLTVGGAELNVAAGVARLGLAIGGGDAYAAGFLYGLLTADVATGVRYGNAFSALKQTSWGDLGYATVEEVETLLRGERSRIVR